MEISTGAFGACELDPVCAETSAFSLGAPIRSRAAFAVQIVFPLIASIPGLGQSFRLTSEFPAQDKLSLLHGV
jgi:hypothetical protein